MLYEYEVPYLNSLLCRYYFNVLTLEAQPFARFTTCVMHPVWYAVNGTIIAIIIIITGSIIFYIHSKTILIIMDTDIYLKFHKRHIHCIYNIFIRARSPLHTINRIEHYESYINFPLTSIHLCACIVLSLLLTPI